MDISKLTRSPRKKHCEMKIVSLTTKNINSIRIITLLTTFITPELTVKLFLRRHINRFSPLSFFQTKAKYTSVNIIAYCGVLNKRIILLINCCVSVDDFRSDVNQSLKVLTWRGRQAELPDVAIHVMGNVASKHFDITPHIIVVFGNIQKILFSVDGYRGFGIIY